MTIPASTSDTPAVPDCPPWCLETAGHHDLTHVPRSWTRFHLAYRHSFPSPGGPEPVNLFGAVGLVYL